VLIPFTNELSNLGVEVLLRVNIRDAQACALEDAEPLLHLVHPGAVDRRKVPHQSWLLDSPRPDFCAVMCADMIASEMNRREMGDNLRVQLCQNGDECLLTLARGTWPTDDSRTGIAGGQYIQGPTALIFMRRAVGHLPRLSGPRRSETRTGWSGGVLINCQAHLVIRQETCVEVDELRDGCLKGDIAWGLGRPPAMMAPGLAVMARQKPPYGRGGDTLNHSLSHELACQFGAIPRGEAAA
jgi:hypothetical protein